MKTLKHIFAISACALLAACGSTTTVKVSEYDADGKVVKITETTADTSDFSAYLASADGNATDLRGDISRFCIGWNGYGVSWLSISGGRTKAPVNTKSSSAEALEKIADVIKANKTTLETEAAKVNK